MVLLSNFIAVKTLLLFTRDAPDADGRGGSLNRVDEVPQLLSG
jgi:hypothetical protein